MTAPSPTRAERSEYLAIALVSCAVLIYEIAITRVLSVVLWYHFAFLSVSLAMLGIGAPGVWFALRAPGPRALAWALVSAAVAAPLSIVAIVKLGQYFSRVELGAGTLGMVTQGPVVFTVLVMLLPLLCFGAAVCLLLMRASEARVGRMYGADLLGATVGAALVVPFMHVFPTPALLAGTGLLALAAAVIGCRPWPRAAVPVAGALVAALLWGEPFVLRYTKAYVEEDVLYEKWTPTARLTVFPNLFWQADPTRAFGWGMGDRFESTPLDQLWLEQDGSAGTPITRLTGTPADLPHLAFDVTSVGYQLYQPQRVCIIGAGGGRDILTALAAGATDIDAVELNAHTVRLVSERFKDFSGDIYHYPGVRAVIGEGRSFLTHSKGNYDLIQISLIDSWAATAAGAFALSENYLYTNEAVRLYWERLSADGVIAISRWMRGERQTESLRLALLAEHALRGVGVSQPKQHLAIVQGGWIATLLISKHPLRGRALRDLDDICVTRGFKRHWPPGGPAAPDESVLATVLALGPEVLAAEGIDLSPPVDDRPFFFQTVALFGNLPTATLLGVDRNVQSVLLVRRLMFLMGGLTLLLFFTPFVAAGRIVRGPHFWRGTAYFTCIGLAFMLVETPWIQRFVLYLGHPSYAATVVLATVLLGAGVGSMLAGRLAGRRVTAIGLALPGVVALVSLALGPVFRATLGWAFPWRVVLSMCLVGPAGFVMGFAFPMGLMRFGAASTPWFWAVNGAAGVFAGVCSLALAMVLGFTWVGWIGVFLYAITYLLLPKDGAAASPTRPD